jgi:hypothetical protein
MRGRHSAAILSMIGVHATTIDDYVAIATRLGQDSQFRQGYPHGWPKPGTNFIETVPPVTSLEDFLESAVCG